MKSAIWAEAVKACADPARARHFFNLLSATPAGPQLSKLPADDVAVLTALFSGSQALSNVLIAHPDWLPSLTSERLKYPRRKQGLQQEVNRWLKPDFEQADIADILARVREFKQREMLRVGARDLARCGSLPEIIREISDVADVCLEVVWQVCWRQLTARHGHPFHQDAAGKWQPTVGCVIGLGKLGGQELNYSSDVDVIFVYSEEGSLFKEPPLATSLNANAGRRRALPDRNETLLRSTLSSHQFFNRLAEAFIAEVTRLTPQGALYRIDLRLRPEGDAGPLSRSLASFENYYAQWGQTWERMMLIKGRKVAGDETLAAEFLEVIQPFRYPRSVNENVLREVGTMKDRIENEVLKHDEVARNVKLGRGGIREIEFVVQALQLLHAGRQPFLQGAQTIGGLDKLLLYELVSPAAASELRQAYGFLRDLEHRLQMEDNRQTHTIPFDRHSRERLARLMGFPTLDEFESARESLTANVRRIFDEVLKSEAPSTVDNSPFPHQFQDSETKWKSLLAEHGFRDVEKSVRVLREFVEGPGYVHVSRRTSGLAYQLLPRLFRRCLRPSSKGKSSEAKLTAPPGFDKASARLSDPDRVVTRLDNFISAYGLRATLFELWNSNPSIFDLLVLLFDRSEFLAELAIRTPDLIDDLVVGARLRQRKSEDETVRELRHGLNDADQHHWLRRYHQAELMRIGLRDILGLGDFEQYLSELSALADACLQYALEVVMRKRKLKAPPFTVIGLGKLGGGEIDYGSDLDIVFVASSKAKDLVKLRDAALEVIDLVSRRTEQGLLFHTDARLRPDGEKGLMVNTLNAFEEYYRERAQLWEIQTLTRSRPVAGDLELGHQFQRLAAKLTNFAHPTLPVAAFAPDWKRQIHQMRMRIQKERTPAGKDELAIKTGVGGLMDAEFVAQALCLEHGWHQANTVRVLEIAREQSVLPNADKLIDSYRRLRRVEGILRRWSYEGETVLPDDPAPYFRVSVRCGFASPADFTRALKKWRGNIRAVYDSVFRNGAARA